MRDTEIQHTTFSASFRRNGWPLEKNSDRINSSVIIQDASGQNEKGKRATRGATETTNQTNCLEHVRLYITYINFYMFCGSANKPPSNVIKHLSKNKLLFSRTDIKRAKLGKHHFQRFVTLKLFNYAVQHSESGWLFIKQIALHSIPRCVNFK